MSTRTTIAEAANTAPAQNGGGSTHAGMAMLKQYWPQMQHLLPSHVRKEAWYSAVYAALHRGQDPSKDLDLWRAAGRNPESLMFALFDAARQGLEPGTEQYFLTPRPNRKAKAGVEVLGIRGFQGEIELIYRAGAVASVVVDVVREHDDYRYQRGIDTVPMHRFKAFAMNAERGKLIGVYAYGIMHGGAVSRVVELNLDDIERAKQSSPTARSEHSPWKTDEPAMFLKTAVHRLTKFVPTSAEYRNTVATIEASAAAAAHQAPQLPEAARTAIPSVPQPPTGPAELPTVLDESRFAQPPAPEDNEPAPPAAPDDATPRSDIRMLTEFPPVPGTGDEPPASRAVQTTIARVLAKGGITADTDRYAIAARLAGRAAPITSTSQLTAAEGKQVVRFITTWQDAGILQQQIAAIQDTLGTTDAAAEPAPGDEGDGLPDPDTDPEGWHRDRHPRRNPDDSISRVPAMAPDACQWCQP